MILVSDKKIKIFCNYILEHYRILNRMFGMVRIIMVRQVWEEEGCSSVGEITCLYGTQVLKL